MLSPEVLKWPLADSDIRRSYRTVKDGHKDVLCPRLPFADTVCVARSNRLHCPPAVRDAVTAAHDAAYSAGGVGADALLDPTFLAAFAGGGQLTLASVDDERAFLCVTPEQTVTFSAVVGGRRVTDTLRGVTGCGDKALEKLRRKAKASFGGNVNVSWRPNDADVCPSSVAKYLHNQGATVRVIAPEETVRRAEGRRPVDADGSAEDISTAVDNAVGACLLGVDPAEAGGETVVVSVFKGFFDRRAMEAVAKAFAREEQSDGDWSMVRFSVESGLALAAGPTAKQGQLCAQPSHTCYRMGNRPVFVATSHRAVQD